MATKKITPANPDATAAKKTDDKSATRKTATSNHKFRKAGRKTAIGDHKF